MTTLSPKLRAHQPVAPIDDSSHEPPVLLLGLEVPAAPEHEGLIDGALEAAMALLDNAVLVR